MRGWIFTFPEYSVSRWGQIRTQRTLGLSRVPETPEVLGQCRVHLQFRPHELVPWRLLCDSTVPTGRRGLLTACCLRPPGLPGLPIPPCSRKPNLCFAGKAYLQASCPKNPNFNDNCTVLASSQLATTLAIVRQRNCDNPQEPSGDHLRGRGRTSKPTTQDP